MWYVVFLYSYVSFVSQPFYHLIWRLEAIGLLEETVYAYTLQFYILGMHRWVA